MANNVCVSQLKVCVLYFSTLSSKYVLAELPTTIKGGFHMISDDRGSQVADDRKESFLYNRRQSQTIAEPTFRSAEVSKLHARRTGGKIAAKNMADVEEEILLRANLFLQLVLKRRHRQLQTYFLTYCPSCLCGT